MHAIFAGPVAAIEAQDRLGIGALRRVAGDAVDQIDLWLADPFRLSIAPTAVGPCGSLDQLWGVKVGRTGGAHGQGAEVGGMPVYRNFICRVRVAFKTKMLRRFQRSRCLT